MLFLFLFNARRSRKRRASTGRNDGVQLRGPRREGKAPRALIARQPAAAALTIETSPNGHRRFTDA
jgi:hypothetical protein